MPEIALQRVKSSNVHSVGYDPASRTLAVQFENGRVYHHQDVPPVAYDNLLKAPSIGAHYASHVRGAFKTTAQ